MPLDLASIFLIADTLHSLEKKMEEKAQLLLVLVFSIINRCEINIFQINKMIKYIKLFLIKWQPDFWDWIHRVTGFIILQPSG